MQIDGFPLNMPGPGDAETWGQPVPGDPRYDDSLDDYMDEELEEAEEARLSHEVAELDFGDFMGRY